MKISYLVASVSENLRFWKYVLVKQIDYLSNFYVSPGIQDNTYGPVVLAIGRHTTNLSRERTPGAMSITDLYKIQRWQ